MPQTLGQDGSFLCRLLSIWSIAGDLRVHPLTHGLRVLGRQVHIAADDVGFPAADGLQLVLRRALPGEVGGSGVSKVMKAEVGHAGSGSRRFGREIAVASTGGNTKEYTVVIEPADPAMFLQQSEGLAVNPDPRG